MGTVKSRISNTSDKEWGYPAFVILGFWIYWAYCAWDPWGEINIRERKDRAIENMRSPYKLNKPFSKEKGLSNIFNNKEKNYELRTVYIITINYEQIMTIKTTICKLKVSFFWHIFIRCAFYTKKSMRIVYLDEFTGRMDFWLYFLMYRQLM